MKARHAVILIDGRWGLMTLIRFMREKIDGFMVLAWE
jgi:hypothetical protein